MSKKKIVVGIIVAIITTLANADDYVLTPNGMITILSAGGRDILINNPNDSSLIMCNGVGYNSYLCGE